MHAIYILRASMSSYDGHVARSVRHSQLARGVVIHTAISSVAYSTTGGACLSLRVWPNEKRWCVNAWSARTRGVGSGPVGLARRQPRGASQPRRHLVRDDDDLALGARAEPSERVGRAADERGEEGGLAQPGVGGRIACT